jgi:hypothetical protein
MVIRVLASLLFSFVACNANAEFIKTSAHVYQAADQKGRVIVSQRVPGLYFTSSATPIDIQQFDPTKLMNKGSDDVFVQFDPTINKYTSLVVREKQFKINGSFVMNVGALKVTIDNQNPYCSIISEPEKDVPPSVLGFHGTLEVVNAQGQEAVALFEANQLSEHKSLIKPYYVKEGALLVGDAPVTNSFVGVVMHDKSACLVGDAIVLDEATTTAWPSLDAAGRKAVLGKLKGKRNPLLKLLRMRTTKDSILAFDYLRGTMKSVKVLPDSAPRTICGIAPLEIK